MKRSWLAAATVLGAFAFACSTSEVPLAEGPSNSPPFFGNDGGTQTPSSRGVVLVHAAAFPSFRLCFENYPELRPQPDSKIMPNANVVGVEVGSVIRIDPLTRAPGRVFVIDRGQVEATLGDEEPVCGSLICDRKNGPLGDDCLRPGQDYDEIAPIVKPLGTDRVELLAIAGCANGIVLSNLGVEPSVCGDGWRFASGGLSANVLELSPQLVTPAAGLPVQLVHLSPMADAVRVPGSLSVTFGPLAQGALERRVAWDPSLFTAAPEQILPVERDDPSFYGSHGFRIELAPRPIVVDAGDAGELFATSTIVVEQSLAEVQDLSAPREVPADYYRAASNYVLLLLGDPTIEKTRRDGGPNPNYNARRGLHLLALPILDPNDLDGGREGGDGSIESGATGGPR